MKVLYFIQTHTSPDQIYRLVNKLRKSSPNSHVLISHDFTSCSLNVARLKALEKVDVIKREAKGIRGDFSLVQAYLDGVKWLLNRDIDFDWLINLSGQCYPTQPLATQENFLAKTKFDGFLEHADLSLADSYYGIRESRDRYAYQYWHSGIKLTKWQRGLLKPLRLLVNNSQAFFRIDSSYQLSLGIRDNSLFNQNFVCYGGSFFKILSKDCIHYLNAFSHKHPEVIEYYKKTRNADESYIQTVLANSGLFNLYNGNKFFIDWTGSRHGHPRTLTVNDYGTIIKDEIYFARKFEPKTDSQIIDMLDERILEKAQAIR